MKETNLTAEILHAGVFLIVGAVVLLSGWNEPLRYLFMSQEEIVKEERALFVETTPENRPALEWRPGGTALDRGPYKLNEDKRTIEYTDNIDFRQMGTPSEAAGRSNLQGKR
jgi:hypothetical protein